MAQFKEVFSTTAKVVLALVIISAVITLGSAILGGFGSLLSPPASNSGPSSAAAANVAHADAADAVRTSMPKSEWDRGIGRAVKRHCYTGGMSKEEVSRALGDPTEKKDYAASQMGSTWTWQLPPGKCLKYEGDQCLERETNQQIIFFTAKGNVDELALLCESLNGDSVLVEDIFGAKSSR